MRKDQIIELAVEAGVKAAIEHIEKHKKQQVKSRHDKRLHNTKLLFEHYNLFKDHCRNSIDNFKTAVQKDTENAVDILDALEQCSDNVFIQSIKQSITRTYTIMQHVDTMLGFYNTYCERSRNEEDARRYRVLKAYYIDAKKISTIADNEHVDSRTCYRDINDALDKMSSLIFGIDWLSEMS